MNQSQGGPGHGLLHELAAVTPAEWAVALVCALVAAIVYEAIVKATRKVTAMLPFILLLMTRPLMSGTKWHALHRVWRADLYDIVHNPDGHALARYLRGLRFSLSLLLHGAIRTARETPDPGYGELSILLATLGTLRMGMGGPCALVSFWAWR